MRSRAEFSLALLVQVVGSAAVLLLGTRDWQTITVARTRPLRELSVDISGRTVDSAPTALALVALAGVVAVLATKGLVRRGIGALVALAGAGLVLRCSTALSAVSAGRARQLLLDKHPSGSLGTSVPAVTTHAGWGVLSIAAGVLVLLAGLMIAVRGGRWAAMSSKYETPEAPDPEDAQRERARADASMWTALERGEDPTARDPRVSD